MVPGGVVAAAFCPQPPLLVPEIGAGAAAELTALRAACDEAVRRLLAAGPERLYVLGAGPEAAGYPDGGQGTMAGFGVDVPLGLGRPGPVPPVAGPPACTPPVPASAAAVPPVPTLPVSTSAAAVPPARTSPVPSPDVPPAAERAADGAGGLPLPLGLGGWLLARAGAHLPVLGLLAGPGGELPPLELAGPAGLLVMGDGSARRDGRSPEPPDPRAAPYDATVAGALRSGDPAALRALDPALGSQLLAAGAPAWRAAGQLRAGARYGAQLLYARAPYGVAYLVASWRRR